MRIIFTGSGEFGLPTLRQLRSAGHQIVAVFTQPDRPAGRGRKLTPTPIGQFALDQSLPTIRTENLNGESIPESDLMVVIAFGQKIAAGVVNRPRLGSVNLHASRLPKYRGAAPINWVILNGEKVTGNSVIRLAQRMDAGAILGQSSLEIGDLETAGELHDRLSLDGANLFMKTISELENGKAIETAQLDSEATVAPKLSREVAQVDWSASADVIARKIRGLYPWPGCRLRMVDAAGGEVSRVILVRAKAVEGEGPRWHPGEISGDGHINCADGWQAVEVLELQPEGKRSMSLADYRRGNTWAPGMQLKSIAPEK